MSHKKVKNLVISIKFRTFAPVLDISEEIRKPIASEFVQYEQTLNESLHTDNLLLQQALQYVLSKRGKQLRPMLVLLSAKLCHGVTDKTLETAVAMELLHTASLIHDDVVDDSPMRRGAPSVHARWNNKVAVLLGDYILAKVIEITAQLRNLKILGIVANMGKTLSSGELLQLHANESIFISEEQYMRVIEQKTASLFAACAQGGAASSGATAKQESALTRYGKELGIIFQLKDDLLDYSELEIGKPTMQDLVDGKVTMPLICALARAPKEEAEAMRTLAEKVSSGEHTEQDLQTIQAFVVRYDGIGYTQKQMEIHKKTALEALNLFHTSATKGALVQLLQYAIIRNI